MTSAISIQTLLSRLQAPRQDLAQLTFCNGNKDSHVNAWIDSLPLTQINYVSMQLYKALPEIGRLQTTPEIRVAMLERLRSPAQQSIQGLSKAFLNQPLLLPETARKSATVAQALQKHMINGYLVAVRELCDEKRPITKDGATLQALAIQRALTGLGLLLLRNYQLYTPIAGQIWIELHALYLIAEGLNLIDIPVDDPLPGHRGIKNIEQTYVRILLLACARPNQLRQDEVVATYNALENLSALGELTNHNTTRKDNLFAVMLESNQPPLYKSRLPPCADQQVRDLSTSQLASKLEDEAKGSASSDTSRNAYNLSAALTDHLIHAWNILAQRSFERSSAGGVLDVTVGLSNIHFHVAGEMPFHLFLDQTNSMSGGRDNDKIFQKRGVQLKTENKPEDDPWISAFDAGANPLAGRHLPTLNIELSIRQQQQQEYQGKHPVYKVPLVDTSPGGYCLEWHDAIPGQLKAGELLGLREEGRSKWGLGVVRWVQQTRDSTQMGVQVLAPHAVPVGIAIVQKTGGFSEYLRALELPALKAVNQPATLITNAISFREYNKVKVYYAASAAHSQKSEPTLQLTQKLFSTGAFCQFSFREVASTKPTAPDDFDEVWKK